MIGFLANSKQLIYIGIFALGIMALFQLVTLPVEFNASSRALKILDTNQLLTPGEMSSAKKMLTAAALTYVAALLSTILSIMRYLAVLRSRDSD